MASDPTYIRNMANIVNLSSVDVEIIRLLQGDARMTNRSLGQAVGIVPSTCLERVQRLRNSSVIRVSTCYLDVAHRQFGRQVTAP